MEFAKGLRGLQLEREKKLRDEDFELFSESLAKKNPLLDGTKGTRSSLWKKELGPFYSESMKNASSIVNKEFDVKLKQIGVWIPSDIDRDLYRKLVLDYSKRNAQPFVFVSLKIALDACIVKRKRDESVSLQDLVFRIQRDINGIICRFLKKKKVEIEKKKKASIGTVVDVEKFSEDVHEDMYHIASYFMDIVFRCQDVVVRSEERPGSTFEVFLSEKVGDYYDPEKTKGRLFNPRKHPMICEPDPWNNRLANGGYLIKEDSNFLLNVGSLKFKRLIMGEFDEKNANKYFLKAVNGLQKTSYRINDKLLFILNHFKNDKAFGYDASKQFLIDQTVNLATGLKGGVFYIPWYLDFRGRMYSSVTQISPQSHDEGRSLLVFAEPMKIENDNECSALESLAVFGYGKCNPTPGKVAKEKMVKWVEEHQSDIMKCAQDPIKNFWFWQRASDKYGFLAFCLEWTNIMQSVHGHRYTSLPVYVDGTCNGFQHYAALLRDNVSAPLVNLKDNDCPGDFYQNIVHKLQESIGAEDFADSSVKTLVFAYVDRSFIKKSIISAGYGAGLEKRSKVTFKNLLDSFALKPIDDLRHLIDVVFDKAADIKKHPMYEKSLVIEDLIDRAIQDICPSFRLTKKWLTSVQSIFNKNNECLCWNNPAGVPVFNFYYHFPSYFKNLFLDGKPHKIQFRDYESSKGLVLKKKKTSSSISPNYIHSLDAGHAANIIVKYVKSMGKDAPYWIASVHDSFACHATHINRLQKIIRETFCKMHSENQLGIFKSQVEERFNVSLPDLPEFGKLDLKEVLKSTYFFC